MKLIAFFVPGHIDAALAVVNELNMTYEFSTILPDSAPSEKSDMPFELNGGYRVILRVSDVRVKWIENNLKRLGVIK